MSKKNKEDISRPESISAADTPPSEAPVNITDENTPAPESAPDISEEDKAKTAKKKKRRKKRITAAVIIAALAVALSFPVRHYMRMFGTMAGFELTDEKFEEICPENTALSSAVSAVPVYSASDTWAFYIYIVGSDLESRDMNTLSDTVSYMVKDEAEKKRRRQETVEKGDFHPLY